MRLTLSFFGALTILAMVFPHSSLAQNSRSSQSAAQPEFGYYVPVLVDENGQVSQTAFSASLSDDEPMAPTPAAPMPAAPMMAAPTMAPMASPYGFDYGYGGGDFCGCSECQQGRMGSGSLSTRMFISAELMHWYNKGVHLPPLVTSNLGPIPPQAEAGVIGAPTTRVRVGNDDIDDTRQTGGRLIFGWWTDDGCNTAIGAKLYGAEGGTFNRTFSGNGNPIIAIPFFNTDEIGGVPIGEDALLVAYPGLSAGAVNVQVKNDVVGGEVFARSLLDVGYDYRLDFIGGYQFARIDSDLRMQSRITTGAADLEFNDFFGCTNEFHGFGAGLYGETYSDIWTIGVLGKIAIGNMRQNVIVDGSNTVVAGGTVTTVGGIFTQPTNIGEYQNDEFVWVPEAGIKLSCALTRRLSLSVGYTFIYFTSVALAGDQIDRNVNATQLNGGAVVGDSSPAFRFNDDSYWIQSVDLGLSFNY